MIGEEVLSVRDLALEGVFKGVTFSLRAARSWASPA